MSSYLSNLSNTTSINNVENTSNVLYLNREADRLKTFRSWTKQCVDISKLAKYGFYHEGPGDAVKCIYCEVIITNWDIGDDPLIEHIYWSPRCPFLLHNAPVNEAIEPNFDTQLPSFEYIKPIVYNSDDTSDEAHRPTHEIILPKSCFPRHPAFNSHEERLKSFKSWPRALKQTPQELSDAGLFYLNIGDQVKCFHCGGSLRDWEDGDKPWIEHAKHYAHCDYVKLRKGELFIEQAKHTTSETNIIDVNTPEDEDDDHDIFKSEDNSLKCSICQKDELNTIFIPCMHVCACENCSASISQCPACHEKVAEVLKCYLT